MLVIKAHIDAQLNLRFSMSLVNLFKKKVTVSVTYLQSKVALSRLCFIGLTLLGGLLYSKGSKCSVLIKVGMELILCRLTKSRNCHCLFREIILLQTDGPDFDP